MTGLLNLQHPIIQAPMAGASTPELVAAVSNTGGLGSLGAAAMKPAALRTAIQKIRALTTQPFNINLFAPSTEWQGPIPEMDAPLREVLTRFHDDLDLGELPTPRALFGPAEEQLQVLIEEQVPVISFHFGMEQHHVDKIHSIGSAALCSATTVSEARYLEDLGVDAVIAQGKEAGGHRGTFLGDYQDALNPAETLTKQAIDAVNVPVIAAGGIMDATGVQKFINLGASTVQIGTAFLGCPESGIAPVWREQLKLASGSDTVVTKVFSGKPARGIRNKFVQQMELIEDSLMPYSLHYSVTAVLRKYGIDQNDPDFPSMWAGEGVDMYRELSVEELMCELTSGLSR